jgi:hypothetical protein
MGVDSLLCLRAVFLFPANAIILGCSLGEKTPGSAEICELSELSELSPWARGLIERIRSNGAGEAWSVKGLVTVFRSRLCGVSVAVVDVFVGVGGRLPIEGK